MTLDQDPVSIEVAAGVATVSLNRPHRHNAIDDATHARLVEVWEATLDDPEVRVVLFRGEGRSFCSGRDVTQLGERTDGESDHSFIRRFQLLRETQLSSPKPIVAALRGAVLGAGLEMALAADIRIGASDLKMAFPEIGYGLMTDTGGCPLTTMLAGPSRAKWMVMTGRPVDADRALAWGLVDEVVEPERLDQVAGDLAAELADKPQEALSMIKAAVDGIWEGTLRTAMRVELLSQVALFAGEDFKARKQAR
ncbi:enoyl-CoA hydratase/isomerase family protein [Sporichthya polymorpha]|uniref:enoyl-CoA hydratase/isomerase family protein n=1 Tax=Sporichthya polymorpha TaxID=35751 RepID=UPI00037B7FB9|nr:enoyl-CoA hydratase/isomerase family protein [Sporichthya polymorpha]